MDQSTNSSSMDISVKGTHKLMVMTVSKEGSGDTGKGNCTNNIVAKVVNSESLCQGSSTKLLGGSRSPAFDSKPNGFDVDLVETLAENILLKKELRDKLEEIVKLRTKLHESFQQSESLFSRSDNHLIGSNSGEIQCLVKLDQQGVTKFPYEIDCDNEEVLEEKHIGTSICEWVEDNRDDVIQTVTNGTIVAKDVALGGFTGLVTAFVLKKFGKLAVTALGGGFLLLQAANYRGYIIVNWNQIYNQLEQGAFQPPALDIQGSKEHNENDDWVTRQFKGFRDWSKNNSKFVIGFLGGFIYQTYF